MIFQHPKNSFVEWCLRGWFYSALVSCMHHNGTKLGWNGQRVSLCQIHKGIDHFDDERLTCFKLDLEKDDEILYTMELKALPTVMIFQNQKGIGKVEGLRPPVVKEALSKLA